MKIERQPQIIDIDPHETRTEAEATHNMGEKIDAADRSFRYAKAGGSDISAGKLQKSPSQITNHHNVAAYVASAVNSNEVTVTLGATLITANAYVEGYLIASDVSPEGESYKINKHPAAASGATLKLTLFDRIKTAITTSSEFCLNHNPYNGVQESTTQTLQLAGVPLVDIEDGDFGWLQTKGTCPVLADETITVGAWVTGGTSVGGSVEGVDDLTTPITEQLVGYAHVAGVDEEYRPITLTID